MPNDPLAAIERLEKLEREATPGPYQCRQGPYLANVTSLASEETRACCADYAVYQRHEDAAYDAFARNTLPALLECARALGPFVRWSAHLAEYAGSAWADAHGLSQDCHWLNESRKEARAALAKLAEVK